MNAYELPGYAAIKLKLVCEVCYPDGAPDHGSFDLASFAFTDSCERRRYRCADHVPPSRTSQPDNRD